MWVISKFVTLVMILHLFDGCSGLKNVKAIVPVAVRKGEDAILRCHYDIERDILYTVKWYKGEREFYRYAPREVPVMKVFKMDSVKKSHSNASVVYLERVEKNAAGRYTCEVSADAPSFQTYAETGVMDVVEVPDHRPTISGVKPKYPKGKVLRGNCTSNYSMPPANLTWYINDQMANPSYLKRYRSPEFTSEDGKQLAILGIHFLITSHHFHNGKLKIRCTAHIYNVYWQSTEKSIEEERPKSTNMANRGDGSNSVNVPPESQHVALMYPVHGTALDPEPPPNLRDSARALGGAPRSLSVDACALITALLSCVRTLRLTGVSHNLR